MTKIKKRELPNSPAIPDIIRVTPTQYSEKIMRTLRRVQQQCKEIESNPEATIDGYRIEKYGGRYLIALPKTEWETLTPRPDRKPFVYDAWLKSLRERRRAITAERKAERERLIKERLERAEKRKQAELNKWYKFALSPISEAWGGMSKQEVCLHLSNFIGELSLIEIPRSKMKSAFYAVRFQQTEELGLILHLESDKDFSWHHMRQVMSLPTYMLADNFWIWQGSLIYFEGLNPDRSPKNPRFCGIERINEKQATDSKFKEIYDKG